MELAELVAVLEWVLAAVEQVLVGAGVAMQVPRPTAATPTGRSPLRACPTPTRGGACRAGCRRGTAAIRSPVPRCAAAILGTSPGRLDGRRSLGRGRERRTLPSDHG